MDHIERPLSILLIVTAITYSFMYADTDGFTPIENNTLPGYNIQPAELSSGYNVSWSESCDIKKPTQDDWKENYELEDGDSLSQNIMDSHVTEIDGLIKIKEEVTNKDEEI